MTDRSIFDMRHGHKTHGTTKNAPKDLIFLWAFEYRQIQKGFKLGLPAIKRHTTWEFIQLQSLRMKPTEQNVLNYLENLHEAS